LKVREYLSYGMPVIVNYKETLLKNDKLKNYIFEFNDSTNIRDLLNHGFNRDEIINSAKEELSWETLLKDI